MASHILANVNLHLQHVLAQLIGQLLALQHVAVLLIVDVKVQQPLVQVQLIERQRQIAQVQLKE